jgi:hypothetical protein
MAKKISVKASKPKDLKDNYYRDLMRDVVMSPAFKYIAAGLGAAVLARLANQTSEKFPEVSSFIKDNMNMLQVKIDEYKSHLKGHDSQITH